MSSWANEKIVTRRKLQTTPELCPEHRGNLVCLSTLLAQDLGLSCGILTMQMRGPKDPDSIQVW